MSKRINLVLLYGGKSGEHEISLRSAASVLANLDPSRYQIFPVGIDKEGHFFLNDYQAMLAYPVSLPVSTPESKPLASLIQDGRLVLEAELVFPVLHGPLYEDGCLQGLLELANVAYVGCNLLSSALGMDKDMARRIACVDGLLAAKYRLFSWQAQSAQLESFCQQVLQELGTPLFVKPCSMGSSVGIHKVHNLQELKQAISDARRYDDAVLVEEAIVGREIELAVLENPKQPGHPRVSQPGEIRVQHPDGFYSYTAKYLESDQTELCIPAPMDAAIAARLQEAAAAIFTRLKCQGLARVDFFLEEGSNTIYFSEINTMPGFTSISMYPKLWEAEGLSYSDLLDALIQAGLQQHQLRLQRVTHYQ